MMSLPSSSISRFITRNRRRNAHLYQSGKQEGLDFVTCPVTGERLSMIKRNYVEKTLGMPYDVFRARYPDQVLVCESRKRAIAEGLRVVDGDGKTRHEVSVEKATISRARIGDDGLSTNQRKGRKTRSSHMAKAENGMNGYALIAKQRNETLLPNGLTVQKSACLKGMETKRKRGTKRLRGASKVSKKYLKPILNFLNEHDVFHYFDDNEYGVRDGGNYYYYDLVIPDFLLAIEFNGSAFHPDPRLSVETRARWRQIYTNRTADEVDNYDARKREALLRCRGFETKVVYEGSAEDDVAALLEEILSRCGMSLTVYKENTDFEILTPGGWCDFSGVLQKGVAELLRISFEDGSSVECTPNHEFFISGKRTAASAISVGASLDGKDSPVTNVNEVGKSVVFDIIEVHNDDHSFFVNGLVTKNCDEFAFVPPNKAQEFWTSIQPTLSTGGACIVTSTPKSDEDQFAQIYKGAIDNTDEYGNPNPKGIGRNGFFAVTVPWHAHPERDEEWAKPYREQLGEARFRQEMECVQGDTIVELHDGLREFQMPVSRLFETLLMMAPLPVLA